MTKPGKHIERAWLEYRTGVIPADARANQVIESRRAFYAGAWTLFQMQLAGYRLDSEPTDDDVQMRHVIDAEIRAFNEAVKVGAA